MTTSRRTWPPRLAAGAGTLALAATSLLSWFACSVEQPGVEDDYATPRFLHDKVAVVSENCVDCHEKDRPSPDHGSGKDCIGCHTPNDQKAGFLPVSVFTHTPPPKSCYPCHKRERPAEPHVQEGDCASCHKFPSWQPG